MTLGRFATAAGSKQQTTKRNTMEKTFREKYQLACEEYYRSAEGIAFHAEQMAKRAALDSEYDAVLAMLNNTCMKNMGKEWRLRSFFGDGCFITLFDGDKPLHGYDFCVRYYQESITISYASMGSFDPIAEPLRLKLLQDITRFAELATKKEFRETLIAYFKKALSLDNKCADIMRLLDNPPALENIEL